VSKLPDETAIGRVELTVRDVGRSFDFYERTLGLEPLARDGAEATLGAGGEPLLVLHGDPDAPERPRRTTGLFHFAVLLPSRADLGGSLIRLAERRWPLGGASDHLVSEALYLSDPDGIGIEIYRDRPRSEWPRDDGTIRMATIPLDLDSVLAEAGGHRPAGGVPPGTRIGHVHLNVADLEASERFWCDIVGFDVTVRGYPGALFVSAGGYHHHLGLNTWNGPGAPPPPAGAIGLRRFSLEVPDGAAEARERLGAAGIDVEAREDGRVVARDPARIAVEIGGAARAER
jgi:catechol 2,3-dioxygenase